MDHDTTRDDDELEIRAERWPFVRVPSSLVVDNGLTDGDKVTYAALALWGGVDGRAWPSTAKLAKARGCSKRSLVRHLAKLHASGWIRRWVDPEGRRVVLVLREPASHVAGGDTCGMGGVTHVAQGGDTRGAQKENQKENQEKTVTCVCPSKPTPRERALELSKVYPHGTTESGLRRTPGIKQAARALGNALRNGTTWEEVLAGAQAYAAAVRDTDDQRYVPAMHRWVAREGWLEVPAPVRTAPTSEEAAASREARELERQRLNDERFDALKRERGR